jgi:hypothetical protein
MPERRFDVGYMSDQPHAETLACLVIAGPFVFNCRGSRRRAVSASPMMSACQNLSVRTNYVFIDYENVQVASLDLLKGEHFRLWVFLGPHDTRLKVPLALAIHEFRERAIYIPLKTGGANALDFHIAYYLGALAKADPTGFFHIISKDRGFDPLVEHLKKEKISVVRSVSVEAMPCFAPKEKPTVPQAKQTDQDLLRTVIDDLIRRKTSKPRTLRTLLTTIHARCGKDLAATRIEGIYAELVKKGFVKVDGAKVSYSLPTEP